VLQQLTHIVLVALQLNMVDTLRPGVFLQGANQREARHAAKAYLRKTVMESDIVKQTAHQLVRYDLMPGSAPDPMQGADDASSAFYPAQDYLGQNARGAMERHPYVPASIQDVLEQPAAGRCRQAFRPPLFATSLACGHNGRAVLRPIYDQASQTRDKRLLPSVRSALAFLSELLRRPGGLPPRTILFGAES